MTDATPVELRTDWVRVSDIETGHHYSIQRWTLDPKVHRLLKRPGADAFGQPYAAKPRTELSSPDEEALPTESRSPAKPNQEG